MSAFWLRLLTPDYAWHAASERAQDELASLKKQKDEVETKMAALKKVLYSKFGDNINLEE